MIQKRPKQPDPPPAPLVFRGLDFCDQCGGPLAKSERLAGLCGRCLVPAKKRQLLRHPESYDGKFAVVGGRAIERDTD